VVGHPNFLVGFNLYHGIKAKENWDRFLWLDLHALAASFLVGDQELHLTKYCTSRISSPPARVKRQSIFIDALKASGGVEVIEGKFQHVPVACGKCGHSWDDYEEKQTDVNIAVELLVDAQQDEYDVAFVISGDTDLIPAFKAVRQKYGKRIVALFPPCRVSNDLGRYADTAIPIGRAKLAQSRLPEEIKTASGHVLRCPDQWVPPPASN